MRTPLELLNPPAKRRRRLLKLAVLMVVVLFTLYPNPLLLVRHIQRVLSPSSLIEPANPRLDALDAEVSARLANVREQGDDLSNPAALFFAIERVVYQRLPYQYDWHNWGCANYFPTVDEALSRARCDCKGRAVVAASLLARRGVQARLVSDLSHVWVWTPRGEAMSPVKTASGRKVLSADARGSRVDALALVTPSGLFADLPLRLGFAVAIFPTLRVAIIALAFWLVLLKRTPHWPSAMLGAWAITCAIVCWVVACENIHHASLLGAWAGLILASLAIALSRRSWGRNASQTPG